MKYINVLNGPQNVSAIIQGCMRMPSLSVEEATRVISNDYSLGINFWLFTEFLENREMIGIELE